MDKKYSIDKKQCKRMIKGVCSRCGGKLEPIETIDNADNPSFWGGCKKCSVFCWGVEKKLFEIAKQLVMNNKLTPYSHKQKPTSENVEELEYWYQSQISGAVSIVYDVLEYYKMITNAD